MLDKLKSLSPRQWLFIAIGAAAGLWIVFRGKGASTSSTAGQGGTSVAQGDAPYVQVGGGGSFGSSGGGAGVQGGTGGTVSTTDPSYQAQIDKLKKELLAEEKAQTLLAQRLAGMGSHPPVQTVGGASNPPSAGAVSTISQALPVYGTGSGLYHYGGTGRDFSAGQAGQWPAQSPHNSPSAPSVLYTQGSAMTQTQKDSASVTQNTSRVARGH